MVQHALVELLAGVDAAHGGEALDALKALVVGGDGRALAKVWSLLMGSASWRDLLDRLGHRDEPFVDELLRADLAAGSDGGAADAVASAHRTEQLDMLRLLLVGRGDRRELAPLVANAPGRDAQFVRRCRHYADRLEPAHVDALFDAAVTSDDADVAGELLEWVARCAGRARPSACGSCGTTRRRARPAEELVEIALRVLASGPRRAELTAELRAALLAGPLPDRLTSLPYELLNGIGDPASDRELRLCAELLVWPALGDPAGERRRARRWPDGDFGFPLVAAIATRLRGVDALAAESAFSAVVEEALGDARAATLVPQRLKVFWRALTARPDLQRSLGEATAPLWAVDAGDGGRRDAAVRPGPALWLLARAAERRGEFGRAEALYRRAVAALLRLPDARRDARWLLGERDLDAGDDPWARLAAAPHRMRLRVAIASGDDDAVQAAAARVREFAGHDRATLATLKDLSEETPR